MVIGYYVHHHGAGHLTRARLIAQGLRARGHDVVLLGSALGAGAGVGVVLPRDDTPAPFVDETADQAMHWAPRGHLGYTGRMGAVATWVLTHRPSVVVVDVSVEVATLVRVLGFPVVVVAQPGERTDAAHTLMFRCATAILAPWPPEAGPCPALSPFVDKVFCVGGICAPAATSPPEAPHLQVVLSGRDGWDTSSGASPVEHLGGHGRWTVVGGGHWVDGMASTLARARVVVSHGGQNAIADIAAAGTPAVVWPQHRPHAEQDHLGAELHRMGLATVVRGPRPDLEQWRSAVGRALAQPNSWPRWHTQGAVERAVAVIQDVARG
ncbi:MAG: glycosyltransferase [Ornithinimicrobium sp.]